jgi:hypothetical protein
MIVKYTHEAVPVIDGLIMIDCWRPSLEQQKNYNDFYIPLLAKLIHFDFKCIVNAAYNVILSTEDTSIRNTFRTYYWSESKTPNVNIVQNLIKYCGGANHTSALFQETLLNNNDSIMLLDFDDFVYHWQSKLDCKVNNWLVVGQAWKNCVHRRPIGLDNMYRMNPHRDLNFYAIDGGFNTRNDTPPGYENFQQDSLPWAYIENCGYTLITISNNHWTRSMDFYREFMCENRIAVEIHCTADIAPLISNSDDTFDITVVHEPTESWQFSYSKFAGVYQLSELTNQKRITIWVFDITESLELKVLMSYTDPIYSSFITKNQKVVIFNTGRITSTHEIENFVK